MGNTPGPNGFSIGSSRTCLGWTIRIRVRLGFAAPGNSAPRGYGFMSTYPNIPSMKCGSTAHMTRNVPGFGK